MKKSNIMTVFISSPGEMSDQRQVVEQTVKKFSENYSDDIKFEVTHFDKIASEFGDKPQNVINSALPDYDVYIGLMGARFGTPTDSYSSGTEEEFNIALQKRKEDENIHVSFLFKEIQEPLNSFNEEKLSEYSKVLAFKKKHSSEGVYQTFNDNDDLSNRVSQILKRVLAKYSEAQSQEWHQMEMLAPVPSKQSFIIDSEFYSDFLNSVGADLSNNRKANIFLDDIYVPLDLSPLSYSDDDEDLVIEDEFISADDIDKYKNQSQTKIFICGDENSGKTTLIKRTFLNFHASGVIPVYIKGNNIKNASKEKFLKHVEKQFVEQYSPDALGAYKDLDSQKKLLIIDNLTDSTLNDKYKLRLLSELEDSFSHVFVTTDEVFLFNAKLSTVEEFESISSFKVYKLRDVGHRLRDDLIKKWLIAGREDQIKDENLYDETEKYRSIVDTILGTNFVPKKPLVVLVLLQAIQGGSSNQLAHSSYVRYYKYLIDTSLLSNIEAAKIDIYYTFLPALAYRILSNGNKYITQLEMDVLIKDFCNKKGLDLSLLNDVKSNLISLEVITHEEAGHCFKHNYTYYYFLGQYLSDNLDQKYIKEKVKSLCKKLHVRENSNIIIFLSYHSHDNIIIDSISEIADSLFNDVELFRFENLSSSKINELVEDSPKVIVEYEKEKTERRKILNSRDRVEKNYKEEDISANDVLDIGSKINLAFRTIEIIGQLLKNHYVSFDADPKKELYIKSINLAMKCLNFLIGHISEDTDVLLQLIRDGNEQIKTEKEARKVVFSFASWIVFNFIKSTSQYTGSSSLSKTYEDVVEENNFLVYRIIELSTKLDFFDKFPMTDVKNLALSSEKNHLAMSTIRNLVKYRLYMRPIDNYKIKDQICSAVGISSNKQTLLQNKSKKTA